MNAFLDFIRAAAPWVAMGLLVIIFCVRGAAKNKNEKSRTAIMAQRECAWECALELPWAQRLGTTPASASHWAC